MDKIFVGVDGSEHAAIALRWAATRSEQRGDEVVAIFAWTYIDHDADASMIVVANRGFGPVKRVLLGSTSHQVVQHATVPVVVVS